jgi:RNA polymerase sigma factor (TIGR02999 family)
MNISDPDVYSELKSIAKTILKRERKNDAMSSVDLFHEAYCRLNRYLKDPTNEVRDIKALFAQTMRHVVVDNARRHSRRTQLLARIDVELDQQPSKTISNKESTQAESLLMLDQALIHLSKDYPSHARVVELKYFGGLTIPQCAKQLGLSEPTVQRYWAFSRDWLACEMLRLADDQ